MDLIVIHRITALTTQGRPLVAQVHGSASFQSSIDMITWDDHVDDDGNLMVRFYAKQSFTNNHYFLFL